jgi:hypothetical protein
VLEVTVMLAGVVSCLFSGRRYGGTREGERIASAVFGRVVEGK